MARYYMKPGPSGSNSFSVFNREESNEWGEDACIEPLVTFEEAKKLTDKLNF